STRSHILSTPRGGASLLKADPLILCAGAMIIHAVGWTLKTQLISARRETHGFQPRSNGNMRHAGRATIYTRGAINSIRLRCTSGPLSITTTPTAAVSLNRQRLIGSVRTFHGLAQPIWTATLASWYR